MFRKSTLAILTVLASTTFASAESDSYLDGKMYTLLTIGKNRCGLSLTSSGERALARTAKIVLDGNDGTRGGFETGQKIRAMDKGAICDIITTNLKEYLK